MSNNNQTGFTPFTLPDLQQKFGLKSGSLFFCVYLISTAVLAYFQYTSSQKISNLNKQVSQQQIVLNESSSISAQLKSDIQIATRTQNDFENEVKNILNQSNNQEVNNLSVGGANFKLGDVLASNIVKILKFDTTQWWRDDNIPIHNDFYCPNAEGFEYWGIWTRENLPLEFSTLRLRLQLKTNSDVSPMFTIGYGNYEKRSASPFYYRTSFFEKDLKTIRIYPNNRPSDYAGLRYFKVEPDVSKELFITLTPKLADISKKTLNLNYEITYWSQPDSTGQSQEETYPFVQSVDLEIVGPTNRSLGQLMIGAGNNVCFKVVDLSIE